MAAWRNLRKTHAEQQKFRRTKVHSRRVEQSPLWPGQDVYIAEQSSSAGKQGPRRRRVQSRNQRREPNLSREAIYLVHGLALMVAPCQVHMVGVHQLQGKKREDDLSAVGPPVHKVTCAPHGMAFE